MYNWVTRRVLERTQPQQVFKVAVDAKIIAWMPAIALLASSCVTPARAKLDVRQYDWSPSSAWITPIATAAIAPTVAPASSEAAAFRTRARTPLDVRLYEWRTDAPFVIVSDATVRTWEPAFSSELASARTPDGPKLDVRRYEWDAPESAWIKATQTSGVTTAQTVPAWQTSHFRTVAARLRDVRYDDSAPQFGVPDDPSSFDGAIFSDDGGRTAERPKLDVRRYDWASGLGWIVATFPAQATQAQLWPAISQGSDPNYRTRDRARLDVRSYDWAPADDWIPPVVQAQLATFAGVFSAEAVSVRTPGRPALDVRSAALAQDTAWITAAQPQAATTAQLWPAIQQNLGTQYRTAARAKLDVRAYEWAPVFDWVQAVIDAVVAKWAPVFGGELASFRTVADPKADVRIAFPSSSAAAPVLATNQAPVVSAGSDIAITLPATASLSGIVTDDSLPVAAVVTTLWTTISGPSTVVYTSATSASTTATFDTAGVYVLRLTASDTLLSAFDEVTVTVTAAPVAACDSIVAQVTTATGDGSVAQGSTATGDSTVSQ